MKKELVDFGFYWNNGKCKDGKEGHKDGKDGKESSKDGKDNSKDGSKDGSSDWGPNASIEPSVGEFDF